MFSNNRMATQPSPNPFNPKFGLRTDNSSQQSSKKLKIYSALYNDDAHLCKFGELETVYHPSHIETTNSILVLHGGADISPSIYGHQVSKRTHADKKISARDQSEVLLARRAIELGIPIMGLCRGAQLACALAGGSLIQHVDNHGGGRHEVVNKDGEVFETTTCHHQMMNPWEIDHELIAWAAPSRSEQYIVQYEELINMPVEPEVVFFPKIKALAIQGHPEWMQSSEPFVQYCLNLVKERLL